jgi:hypothetical protein
MSFPHGSLVIKISMGAQSLQVAKNELDNPIYNCLIPVAQLTITNRQERESEQIIHLLLPEEATNFKVRSIVLASVLKIELTDGNR